MTYPIKLIEVLKGLQIYLPDPDQVRSTYERSLRENGNIAFPYWAQIWPSAKALSQFLLKEKSLIEGKSCLELGAGIGLPSFSIAQHSAEIMISDHSPEAVELLDKNIHHLGLQNATAICLDWNQLPDNSETEVLILSDVNYDPQQFESLILLVKKFIAQGTTIILSSPQRITITPFAEAIQPFIQRSELMLVPHLQKEVEIRILVLEQN